MVNVRASTVLQVHAGIFFLTWMHNSGWIIDGFSLIKMKLFVQGDPERGEVSRFPSRSCPFGHQQEEKAHKGEDARDSCERMQQQVFFHTQTPSHSRMIMPVLKHIQ